MDKVPEYLKQIEEIERSGQYLSEIINSIIDISNIESGEISYDEVDINIRKFIKNLFYVNKIEAIKKNVDLRYDVITDELPEYIRSDRTKLETILNSIVDNAIKFTPVGKQIRINLLKEDESLVFKVIDKGIGISDDKQEAIFEPFEQMDKSESQWLHGIGLGLSVAKKMTAILRGSIALDSKKGIGSTFTVKIPLIKSGKQATGEGRIQEELIFKKNSKILIVEDNLITQELISKILSNFDLFALVANNGKRGVKNGSRL